MGECFDCEERVMGIYIPGMEMPESCYYCPFADGVWQKNKRCLINGKEMPRDGRDVQQNHINCPLIEIPPHGDLIDRDALYEVVKKRTRNWAGGWNDIECVLTGNDIKNAPTIIDAEEGET